MSTAESILVPVILDQQAHNSDSKQGPALEQRQAFLVHLNVSQLVVTVFTTEEFADDKDAGVTEKD